VCGHIAALPFRDIAGFARIEVVLARPATEDFFCATEAETLRCSFMGFKFWHSGSDYSMTEWFGQSDELIVFVR
jgi:hypothetical protein